MSSLKLPLDTNGLSEQWHKEVFGNGVNDSCELLPYDECNGDALSVAIGEEELNKFSALALKYGLNMNVF